MIFSASCDLAVNRMMGVRTPALRSSRQTSKPSFFGSITSSTIRSHPLSRPRAAPSSAVSCHLHVVTFQTQVVGQQHGDVGFILHYQYPRHLVCPPREDES